MTSSKRISICIAALLTACGNVESFDSPDAVEVSQVSSAVVAPAPAQKGEAILIHAPSYLNSKYEPQFATLSIFCSGNTKFSPDVWLGADITDGPTRGEFRPNGFPVTSGEVLGGHNGLFFQRGDIYFDDELTEFPSIYETVVKDIDRKDGTTERRSERILVGPSRAINEVFIPNVKTAKTMRFEYMRGIGPTFDLGDLKSKIETLETQCAPKDFQK